MQKRELTPDEIRCIDWVAEHCFDDTGIKIIIGEGRAIVSLPNNYHLSASSRAYLISNRISIQGGSMSRPYIHKCMKELTPIT